MKMKLELGAEPKKVAILAGLLVVAAYLMYTNVFSASTGAPQQAYTPPPAPAKSNPLTAIRNAEQEATAVTASAGPARNARSASAAVEFRPSLKPKRPEDRPDMARVDPALRLDLLAKLQQVTLDGAGRSLFDFGSAPPPKLPEPKILPGRGKKKGAEEAKLPVAPPQEVKLVDPPKPPPPPIPLKFYGYIAGRMGGEKRAFFLQGEDIFVVGEGETIKSRFKVVKIGINAATVEDVQYKNQQSLPLELVPNV
ncbi:MAG TPA: hypothetical protein VFB63_27685 [Bryobacteraceae bacterium]|nr:hypothetical protein [Bryobacteraceae bacterium]